MIRGNLARLTLLERNRVACARARARLGTQAMVVEADATQVASWSGLGPQDAVLMVGAVQSHVVGPDAARTVLAQARAVLRPGGVVVITGLSPCLLSVEDMTAAGFAVWNRAVPPSEAFPQPRQLYVLHAIR